MDLVFKHPSGGELWQGSISDAHRLLARSPERIRTIGLFAQEFQHDRPAHPKIELLNLGFNDNFSASGPVLDQIKSLANRASDRLAIRIREGRGVLSSCAMGLNRSGLVSALTLLKLGIDPERAVRMIRNARGPQALSNPAFFRLVTDLDDVQEDRSAWTRWVI